MISLLAQARHQIMAQSPKYHDSLNDAGVLVLKCGVITCGSLVGDLDFEFDVVNGPHS